MVSIFMVSIFILLEHICLFLGLANK